MSRAEAALVWPVLKAFAEGQAVQCRYNEDSPWRDLDDPETYLRVNSNLYRVKPREPRVFYKAKYSDGELGVCTYTEDETRESGASAFKFVKFAEVLE